MKLDRFLAKHDAMGGKNARRLLMEKRVSVDGNLVTDGTREVNRFSRIELDTRVIQESERAIYLMLHKPMGYLSATMDDTHPTILDLIDDPDRSTLHIAGRLDRNTSGLVLLTNDGRWSKRLMTPDKKVPKVYLVETSEPIALEAVAAFAEGFYFHTEDLTTLPARLIILDKHHARLTLYEGRYHQVKRMFHRVNNRVISLHRESIGSIKLPSNLAVGQWRPLTAEELQTFHVTSE